ncbi:MAG TPA: formate dehydrogenase accessory sulfurtransferase FdhD [Burkholderiaceae bacterium]
MPPFLAADNASAAPLPPALETVHVQVFSGGARTQRQDSVAAETPVALVFNGISHAVMMATPQDLEDFALGFALSEGIVDSVADCRAIDLRAAPACAGMEGEDEAPAIEVHLEIASRCFARLKERRRSLAGRTGCGLCGIDSLAALDLVPERAAPRPWLAQVDQAAVLRAMAALPAKQILNAQAGAIHAAGWAAPDGTLFDVLEDVGRHNALDKLLGRLAREGRLGQPGFVVMSSRASYELVRKCARLGVAALAAISAPTGLAVRIAEQAGMRLWGLCRDPRAVLYVAGSVAVC